MKTKNIQYIVFLLVIGLLLSCSNTKRLAENESLLIKNKIIYQGLKPDKETEHILQNALRPKPNRKILGFRVRLKLYNAMGEPKKDNFWQFVKENMGEEPVLYSKKFTKKIFKF